jgi:hypothetical protein
MIRILDDPNSINGGTGEDARHSTNGEDPSAGFGSGS